MKQKRKVKSLIPHKTDFSGNFLTVLLLVLSVVLCLGSASLMTASVWAQESEDRTNMIYSWNDGVSEALYDLLFMDPESLWSGLVDELFMGSGSLYLISKPVRVVSSESNATLNTVDTSSDKKYINVLWWEGVDVKSDNMTIIAGYWNGIESGNDNSSVLWWESNKLRWISNDVPAVIAWWKGNIIENNKGDVILWWSENKINWSKNSIILWWEGNEIQEGENVIIWWKKVKVNSVSNIFAFSDSESDFRPEFSNAFYLDLTNWVGVNADAARTWVSVGGAVWFWDIDGIACNPSNVWLEWVWNIGGYGCLVWCTRESSTSSKWELLDRWTLCEAKCRSNSSRCIVTWMNTSLQEKSDYVGYCVIDNIDVENASRCTSWEEVSYNNVVFEGVLIDSSDECPMLGDNKCVYRCDEWYVLDWNKCVSDWTVITKECTWPEISDENATRVSGSEWLTKSQDRKLYDRWDAAGKKCAYECNEGYYLEGNACVKNWRVEPCAHGEKPDNSHYIDTWVIVWMVDWSWTSPAACLWDCDGEYIKDWDQCVLHTCVWDRPVHAYFITGSDNKLTDKTRIVLYSTESEVSPDDKCVYVCEDSYYARNGNCVNCPSWRFDDAGLCVSDVCPLNKPFFNGEYCDPYALCKRNSSFLTVGNLDSFKYVNEKGKYITPLTNESKELKCIDADDPEWWKVENNTCSYSCKQWYYCNRDLGSDSKKDTDSWCQMPTCNWDKPNEWNPDVGKIYYEAWWKKWNHAFWTIFSAEEILKMYDDNSIGGKYSNLTEDEANIIRQNYNKFSNITTKAWFHELFDDWWEKCVYWCPEENRYYREWRDKPYIYSCMKDKTTADAKNYEYENTKHCKTSKVYWQFGKNQWNYRDKYKYEGNPLVDNKAWTYVPFDEYQSKINQWESCIWTCIDWFEEFESSNSKCRLRQQNELFDKKTGNFITRLDVCTTSQNTYHTCFKNCDENQYLDVNVYSVVSCKKCEWWILTGYQRFTYNGKTYSAYRICEKNCDGQNMVFNSQTSNCECIDGSILKDGKCVCDSDSGFEWDDSLGKCVQSTVLPCEGNPEYLKYCRADGKYTCGYCASETEEWDEDACKCLPK